VGPAACRRVPVLTECRVHHRPGSVSPPMPEPGSRRLMCCGDRSTSRPARTMAISRGGPRGELPIMCYNNPPRYGVRSHAGDVRRAGRRAAVRGRSRKSSRTCGGSPMKTWWATATFCFAASTTWCRERAVGAQGWFRGWSMLFRARTACFWTWSGRPARRSPQGLPLVHAALAPRHADQAGAVHQTGDGRVRPGERSRPPSRLPLVGEERKEVLAIIREGSERGPEW